MQNDVLAAYFATAEKHGEYVYDHARDGYHVFVDGFGWHFIARTSLTGELVAMGGIPRQ